MEGIKITLVPNLHRDYQSLTFEDLGVTFEEWTKMDEEDQRILILENIAENIYSSVEDIDLY